MLDYRASRYTASCITVESVSADPPEDGFDVVESSDEIPYYFGNVKCLSRINWRGV